MERTISVVNIKYGGRIHRRLEFLNELKVLFEDGEAIEDKWISSCTDYIIKFTAPVEYFAWNTFYHDKLAYENDFASKDELKRWLINEALFVIWSYYCYKEGPSEIIAYLKPEVFIPYENIVIENN